MFNTRELAYLIWGTVLIVWLLFSKSSRSSMGALVAAFFCKQFVYVYLIAISYISACVFLLYKIRVWETSLIKDTVMWGLFVALPLMYQAGQIKSFDKFKKEVIRPLITFSILFEYIFGLYTFDWWIEILMVPVVVLIAGTMAFSERNPEHQQVHRFVKGLLTLIGLVSIVAVIIHLFGHYTEYLNLLTLLQFAMPLLLSLLFLPLLYGISMYVHYETAFITLKRHFRHAGMYKYVMFRAMLRFNGDLEGLERWKSMIFSKNLQNREEINEAITLVKTLQKAERNPHTVNQGLGWSPYQVKDLLADCGIKTADYKNVMDEDFFAISFPLKLNDNSALSDTITYTVLGEQFIATELDLELKVYNGSNDNSLSLLELLHCAEILYEFVFEKVMPKELKTAILKGRNYSLLNSLSKVSVKKEYWHNQTLGYSIDFKITHEKHRR